MNNPEHNPRLVEQIDAWLPQTQCTQCGYPCCLDYARAVAAGEADIDQCPPGGEATIGGLAGLLGRAPKPLNTAFGIHRSRTLVRIDEPRCIGCTLCIQACPVDAIAGATKLMHTVIESECTGCELCLPACPVDCIDVLPAPAAAEDDGPWSEYSLEETGRARRRARARVERLARRQQEQRLEVLHRKARGRSRIKKEIAAAVSRVRAHRRRAQHADHE